MHVTSITNTITNSSPLIFHPHIYQFQYPSCSFHCELAAELCTVQYGTVQHSTVQYSALEIRFDSKIVYNTSSNCLIHFLRLNENVFF
jgi:hypothetical protein